MAGSVTGASIAIQGRGNITVEDRHKLSLSGVHGMGAATQSSVYVESTLGGLAIKGADLHIQKFSQEEGVLVLTGKIDSIIYTEPQAKQSFVKRFFK